MQTLRLFEGNVMQLHNTPHRAWHSESLPFFLLYGHSRGSGIGNSGPETEPSKENQGQFLEELSESIRPYLPKHCIALMYDLYAVTALRNGLFGG